MERITQAILAAAGIACIALAGCGNGNGSNGGNTNTSNTSGTNTSTDSGGSGDSHATDGATHTPAPSAAGTQDTPGGAVQLLIDTMAKQKDPEAALAYVDPTCELYAALAGHSSSIEQARSNPAVVEQGADQIVVNAIVMPWAGATYRIVSEEGDRAQAIVTSKAHGDVEVEVVKTNGLWFVLADDLLARPKPNASAPPVTPPTTPPTTPTTPPATPPAGAPSH